MRLGLLLLGGLALAAYAGCASHSPDAPAPTAMDDASGGIGDPFDVPINGSTKDLVALFQNGDALFDLPLRENDGLGPLYTRTSCSACHDNAARGPGLVQKMVVVDADGVSTSADQSLLPFGHTVHAL